jgi:uncharacterized protein (TIGR02147 family)
MRPEIYTYLDYREFLNDLFKVLGRQDPGFSRRAFARMCGSSSPNFLQLILSGKISLQPGAIKALAVAMKMDKREIKFLDLLIAFDQAKTFTRREQIYKEILQLKVGQSQNKVDKTQYTYYSKWYHSAIRALLGYYKFNPDKDNFNTLGSRLSPAVTGKQARSSIKLLQKLGLIRVNELGLLEQCSRAVSSGPNTRSLEIFKYQTASMDLAKEALDKVSLKQREISTLTLNISEQGYEKIKDRIIQMRKEIIEIAGQDSKDDRVYQANFQLFPLTKLK